jgi:hypothetical protein
MLFSTIDAQHRTLKTDGSKTVILAVSHPRLRDYDFTDHMGYIEGRMAVPILTKPISGEENAIGLAQAVI